MFKTALVALALALGSAETPDSAGAVNIFDCEHQPMSTFEGARTSEDVNRCLPSADDSAGDDTGFSYLDYYGFNSGDTPSASPRGGQVIITKGDSNVVDLDGSSTLEEFFKTVRQPVGPKRDHQLENFASLLRNSGSVAKLNSHFDVMYSNAQDELERAVAESTKSTFNGRLAQGDLDFVLQEFIEQEAAADQASRESNSTGSGFTTSQVITGTTTALAAVGSAWYLCREDRRQAAQYRQEALRLVESQHQQHHQHVQQQSVTVSSATFRGDTVSDNDGNGTGNASSAVSASTAAAVSSPTTASSHPHQPHQDGQPHSVSATPATSHGDGTGDGSNAATLTYADGGGVVHTRDVHQPQHQQHQPQHQPVATSPETSHSDGTGSDPDSERVTVTSAHSDGENNSNGAPAVPHPKKGMSKVEIFGWSGLCLGGLAGAAALKYPQQTRTMWQFLQAFGKEMLQRGGCR